MGGGEGAMQRFRVVVFQTIAPLWADRALVKGGGVCFLPLEASEDWPAQVTALIRRHFHARPGPMLPVGIATLDVDLLRACCQVEGAIFWQGGDTY